MARRRWATSTRITAPIARLSPTLPGIARNVPIVQVVTKRRRDGGALVLRRPVPEEQGRDEPLPALDVGFCEDRFEMVLKVHSLIDIAVAISFVPSPRVTA